MVRAGIAADPIEPSKSDDRISALGTTGLVGSSGGKAEAAEAAVEAAVEPAVEAAAVEAAVEAAAAAAETESAVGNSGTGRPTDSARPTR